MAEKRLLTEEELLQKRNQLRMWLRRKFADAKAILEVRVVIPSDFSTFCLPEKDAMEVFKEFVRVEVGIPMPT